MVLSILFWIYFILEKKNSGLYYPGMKLFRKFNKEKIMDFTLLILF